MVLEKKELGVREWRWCSERQGLLVWFVLLMICGYIGNFVLWSSMGFVGDFFIARWFGGAYDCVEGWVFLLFYFCNGCSWLRKRRMRRSVLVWTL